MIRACRESHEDKVIRFSSDNDVLSALDSGDLRVGIHVQAFADGKSDSFISGPGPHPSCPLPARFSSVPWASLVGEFRRSQTLNG